MPKKINNVFDANLTFEKILQAHYRARKNKVNRNEIIKFEISLENNITNLLNKIKNNTYVRGEYRQFTVKEPKERIIKALPYIDRIVHQWYVEEFIKPYIVPKFISTSFACIPGRGTHLAADTVQKMMRIYKRNHGDFWILKCDIKKYFYNIDQRVLCRIMKKYIKDSKLLKFTYMLICDNSFPDYIGIPIGNYTSQFFANIYLNELDQYVKRVLKIKNYVRYMDDFVIILKTKGECKIVKQQIQEFLNNNLHLTLNEKTSYYPYKMGVNFCGYRIFCTHRLLRRSSKTKINNSVKKWNKKWSNKELNIKQTMQSFNSWLGHASHCNSYNLTQKVIRKADFIYVG